MKLTPYRNRAGDSGVLGYALGPGWIVVQFHGGDRYLYDRTRPGARDVAALQRLATAGRGLSTYISTHVRARYARKL